MEEWESKAGERWGEETKRADEDGERRRESGELGSYGR